MKQSKNTLNLCIISATVVLILSGCANQAPYYVDPATDNQVVLTLDYKDFERAADQAVNEMLASPLLVHPKTAEGKRHIIAVSNILNDTTQRIDTDQLVKKIRVSLLNSGRFFTTTAIGINGSEDQMTVKSRELKDSAIVDQSTVKRDGTVIAPDYSLSGKIIQRNHTVDRNTQQVDYYFQLTLTNLENGLAYWEGEYPVIKRGSSKMVSW